MKHAQNFIILFQEASKIVHDQGLKTSSSFLSKSELVSITEATGRVCAEAVHGNEAVPSFNNSSMDGFAVRSEETIEASSSRPIHFEVQETVLAGHAPLLSPAKKPRACYEIMTGAPIPSGFDAIYKIEDVEVQYDSNKKPLTLVIRAPIAKLTHFRAHGADFALGQKLFEAGTVLMPEQIMALASVGVGQIRVLRKPKIAVLSTGSELTDPREPKLLPGKIRNSTASYLVSAIPFFGAEVRYYGTVTDQREVFVQALKEILKDQPDIILTTGAVSKGTHDFIPDVIREMKADILFHNVAIRPGKPQLFAQFPDHGPAFFGIPGNPVSTAVGLRFFVNTYLRGLIAQPQERPLQAKLYADVEKATGLRSFFKAHATMSEHGTQITSLAGQPSFMVSPLLRANAWVVLEEAPEIVPQGTTVDFYPLYPSSYDYSTNTASNKGVALPGSDKCC